MRVCLCVCVDVMISDVSPNRCGTLGVRLWLIPLSLTHLSSSHVIQNRTGLIWGGQIGDRVGPNVPGKISSSVSASDMFNSLWRVLTWLIPHHLDTLEVSERCRSASFVLVTFLTLLTLSLVRPSSLLFRRGLLLSLFSLRYLECWNTQHFPTQVSHHDRCIAIK